MTNATLYQTSSDNIFKTCSQLLEKCFISKLNVVLVVQEDKIEDLDKFLWTYSRKGFLPHGTKKDPLANKQPIYITNFLENPNEAEVLFLINPNMLELNKDFKRIIIICESAVVKEIKNTLQASTSFESYKQSLGGGWIKD